MEFFAFSCIRQQERKFVKKINSVYIEKIDINQIKLIISFHNFLI